MKKRWLCVWAMIALSAWINPAVGQSGRQSGVSQPSSASRTDDPAGQDEEVITVRREEVLLPVTVRDGQGRPAQNLTAENFLIFDNRVRQEVASFNRERVPANIILLLDASGSVFSQMRFIREAAKEFVRGLLPQDRVAVMQFADRVEVLQDWIQATEAGQLERAIDWRYHPGQRTLFYDGLAQAAREQFRGVEGRRIVILLTDGIDSGREGRGAGQTDFAQALEATRRAETSVYVVSLTASLRAAINAQMGGGVLRNLLAGGYDRRLLAQYLSLLNEAEAGLERLTTETGGRMFLPIENTDLAPAYRAIAEELRTQYIITYSPRPQSAAGEWRQVRVLVTPGVYEVTTRPGYIKR